MTNKLVILLLISSQILYYYAIILFFFVPDYDIDFFLVMDIIYSTKKYVSEK